MQAMDNKKKAKRQWKVRLETYRTTKKLPPESELSRMMVNFWSNEETPEGVAFMSILFEVYFKMRQFPKLHALLFEASNLVDVSLKEKPIDDNIARVYAKCVLELPPAQVHQIWTLFLDQNIVSNLLALEFFSLFVFHLKLVNSLIPEFMVNKFEGCFRDTKDRLQTATTQEVNDTTLRRLLTLSQAWGEMRCLRMTYDLCPTTDLAANVEVEEKRWWDISSLHDYCYEWETLFARIFTESSDLRLKKVGVELLLQKIRWLNILKVSSDEVYTKTIRNSSRAVLKRLIKLFEAHEGVIEVNQLELLLPFVEKERTMTKVTDIVVSQIVCDPKLRKDLSRDCFLENKSFQSSFITSLFESIAALLLPYERVNRILAALSNKTNSIHKFTATTPNQDNEFWATMVEVSKDVTLLTVEAKPFIHYSSLESLVDVTDKVLALEYLAPGNQIRCLLGLSSLLFAIDFNEEMSSSLLKETLLNSLLKIFRGFRSIWLFNYISPSLYLKKLLRTLPKTNTSGFKQSHIYELISVALDRTFKTAKCYPDVANLANLFEGDEEADATITLMTETLILKQVVRVFQLREKANNGKKALLDNCTTVANIVCKSVTKRVETELDKKRPKNSRTELLVDAFNQIMECRYNKRKTFSPLMGKLLDFVCSRLECEELVADESPYFRFLSLLCIQREALGDAFPANFVFVIWELMFPNDRIDESTLVTGLSDYGLDDANEEEQTEAEIDFERKAKKIKKTIKKMGKKLEAKSPESEGEIIETSEERPNKRMKSFRGHRLPPLLLRELIRCCTQREFELVTYQSLSLLRSGRELAFHDKALDVWRAVFANDYQHNDDKLLFLRVNVVDHLLTLLVEIIREANNGCEKATEDQEEANIKCNLSALELIKLMVNMKKCLTSQKLFLVMHCCVISSLDNCTDKPARFSSLFNGVYYVINEMIINHPNMIKSSMATVNAIVQNLLKALMKASDQDLVVGYDFKGQSELQICAQNLERLLTLLSSLKKDYAPFAPHMVAVYINETQKVTVHSTIKGHLLSGIYRVLKGVETKDGGDHSLELIHSRLEQAGREVFKVLIGNYEKYYKFKGYV